MLKRKPAPALTRKQRRAEAAQRHAHGNYRFRSLVGGWF